ncbi:hypothetical protein F511_24192 [Dorcoceras hygrometricum]|uniref:Uncharacterized protein n=1 Tax=Dorcoceras hygrometricum TaxID=472368 RepID=A0A2Z7B9T8_9LAMI|nr:hypothetical protein F511_24192 [Dorcoceras hygrometricum]
MNSEQLTLRKYHMNSKQLNTTNAIAGYEQMQQLVTNNATAGGRFELLGTLVVVIVAQKLKVTKVFSAGRGDDSTGGAPRGG